MDMTELINYFHKAPIATNSDKEDFSKVNKIAVKFGYLIHPDCCTKKVLKWLNTLTVNYNATFYKEWNDVITKSRFELLVDQLIHYSTTYGTEFSLGNGYVPNDTETIPNYRELKVIEPISYNDLYEKCQTVVCSGIALKDSTMKILCDFMLEHTKRGNRYIDLDSIKNREAQVYLSVNLRRFPKDKFAILRCLVYQYTNKMLIIKNRSTFNAIKVSAKQFDSLIPTNHPLLSLSEDNLVELSSIFLRFKPLFLAMKTTKTASVVNRLRKLAVKNHKPMEKGFWETVVCDPKPYSEIENNIDSLDNFHKIRIMNAIKVALFSNESSKVYKIRNGKVYTRLSYNPSYDRDYLRMIYPLFENSLVKSISKKACRVKFNNNINLTALSSEKEFVGNYPFGSSIKLNHNAVVGIFWKNEWGTHDFDLSLLDKDGRKYGWNSHYYSDNADVVYSGDMTNADPYAVETLYMRKTCPDGTVMVNQYNGDPVSKFRFFIAEEEMDAISKHRGKMVDENNIRLDTMINVDNECQKTLGIIHNGVFYFMDFTSGKSIVSYGNEYNSSFIDTMCERSKCHVDLRDILLKAGFVAVDDNPDIDLSNPEKDAVIGILSEV